MDLRALATKARRALLLIEVYDNGGKAVATGSGEGFYCLLTTICGAERLISPCALNSSKWSCKRITYALPLMFARFRFANVFEVVRDWMRSSAAIPAER
jgi:hypothetical protein